jgi:16S rRNA processing protein RimM
MMQASHRVMMSHDNSRILLGRIAAPHGVRGEVLIETYTQDARDIAAYGPLETADGARSLEVSVVRVTPKGVVARIGGIGDRTSAEALKGLSLYVDRARLPAAAEGAFYHADLIGLAAEDSQGRPLGTVVAVANYGAGDLLELRLAGKRNTELIPFTEAFVPVVDVAGRRLIVVLPTGGEDEVP